VLQAYDDPAIATLIGPLGREAALGSRRMRDVEAWIQRAEEAGLSPEEIAPAKHRLQQLGQSNKALQWEAEERRRKEQLAAEEQRKKAELARTKERSAAADQLRQAEEGGCVEELKAAIMRGFRAGLDVKMLIRARHRLMEIEGRPKLNPEPPQRPKLRKEDLAKEMLQAMRKKDLVALRTVLDMASSSGVQLPGLQAARSKLVEWEKANPPKAPQSEPAPAAKAAPKSEAKHMPRPRQAKERTSGVVGPDGQMPLRVVLPDGRRGWLEVDPAETGAMLLRQVLPLKDRAGRLLTNLRFFLGIDVGVHGKVQCGRELEMDRPLRVQAFQAGTLLCIRNDLPDRAPERVRLTCNEAAMAKAAQVSDMMQHAHQLQVMKARGINAIPVPQLGAGPRGPFSDPSSALWRSALKAVIEPFPPFAVVDRLLGGGRRGAAVVVGWNATGDPVVHGRCQDAMQAVGAVHLVLAGAEGTRPGSLKEGESFVEVDPDGHFGSEEVGALLQHAEQASGVAQPFLLALVSRGYLSRRLALALRRHLPESVSYFPCPPYDLATACCEEVPLFEARIFGEARRLHHLGVELRSESLQALDRLRSGWRELGADAPKPVPPGSSPRWRAAFRAVCEPFPSFAEVAGLLERAQRPGSGGAVVLGWGAACDAVVRQRCGRSVQAAGGAHLVLTGAGRPMPGLGPRGASESLLGLDTDTIFGAKECDSLVEHLRAMPGVGLPSVLLVVSRGYLSRRLSRCLRAHLPVGWACLPCPPNDAELACQEEVPLFEAQIMEEARRLLHLGEQFDASALEAFDTLRPGWQGDALGDAEGPPAMPFRPLPRVAVPSARAGIGDSVAVTEDEEELPSLAG